MMNQCADCAVRSQSVGRLASLSLGLVMIAIISCASTEAITFPVKPIEPFVIREGGSELGFSANVRNLIFYKLTVEPRFDLKATVREVLEAVEWRTVDASIAAITVDVEREELIDFAHSCVTRLCLRAVCFPDESFCNRSPNKEADCHETTRSHGRTVGSDSTHFAPMHSEDGPPTIGPAVDAQWHPLDSPDRDALAGPARAVRSMADRVRPLCQMASYRCI
jgi:hypothetical protein